MDGREDACLSAWCNNNLKIIEEENDQYRY